VTGLRSVSVLTFANHFHSLWWIADFCDSWMANGCVSWRSELSLRQLFCMKTYSWKAILK